MNKQLINSLLLRQNINNWRSIAVVLFQILSHFWIAKIFGDCGDENFLLFPIIFKIE